MNFNISFYSGKYHIFIEFMKLWNSIDIYKIYESNEKMNRILKMDKETMSDIMLKNNGILEIMYTPIENETYFSFEIEEDAQNAINELEPYLIMYLITN